MHFVADDLWQRGAIKLHRPNSVADFGHTARGGPKGVGEAVNQTVVFTLMLLMVLNSLITAIFIQVKG